MKQILTCSFRTAGGDATAPTGRARMPVEDYGEFWAYLIEELFGSFPQLTQLDPVSESDVPLVVARALYTKPGSMGISLIIGEFDASSVGPTRRDTPSGANHGKNSSRLGRLLMPSHSPKVSKFSGVIPQVRYAAIRLRTRISRQLCQGFAEQMRKAN